RIGIDPANRTELAFHLRLELAFEFVRAAFAERAERRARGVEGDSSQGRRLETLPGQADELAEKTICLILMKTAFVQTFKLEFMQTGFVNAFVQAAFVRGFPFAF